MKVLGKILLAILIWLLIGFTVTMVSVFVGFVVESREFPLGSAIFGGFAGTGIFIIGIIFSLIRIIKKDIKRT
jgi:uncharacterized integral membrane protein